jgi:hypothetical protein
MNKAEPRMLLSIALANRDASVDHMASGYSRNPV